MRPAPAGGLEALPLPGGEPTGLWAAAAVLRAAAAAATGAPLASGGGQVPVLDGWSGEAATAARSELVVVAARELAAADRLTRAAAVLCGYADELDAAQRSVATLQALVGRQPAGRSTGDPSRDGAVAHRVDLRGRRGRPPARRRRGGAPAARAGRRGRRRGPSGTVRAARSGLGGPAADRRRGPGGRPGRPSRRVRCRGPRGGAGRGHPGPGRPGGRHRRRRRGRRPAAGRLGARSRDPVVAQALWERLDPRAGRSAGRRPDRVTRRSRRGGGAAPPRCRTGRRRRTRSMQPRPTRPRGPGWTRGASPGWPRGPHGSVRCGARARDGRWPPPGSRACC